jgi:hypothetical protein
MLTIPLSSLHKFALSDLPDKKVLKQHAYCAIRDSYISKERDYLQLTIKQESLQEKVYTVFISCHGVWDIISHEIQNWDEWEYLQSDDKENSIKKIFDMCYTRVHSDDPFFYWQGIWEYLEKHDGCFYRFDQAERIIPELKKSFTANLEYQSLCNDIRITELIAQISIKSDDIARQIADDIKFD